MSARIAVLVGSLAVEPDRCKVGQSFMQFHGTQSEPPEGLFVRKTLVPSVILECRIFRR